ncbi:hypothetical protein [Paenibacillus aestuarii]|uniref:Inhibitor of sigma-G Gin n=1 Tax=Paenibacillus aestuarii TaxID=516965 RepID=A0ABW0K6T0_9BACL|nr:hypothetical protein [Paenibacillus aestuarii]
MMVTCDMCKRTAGQGQFGTSWVCDDCKIGIVETKVVRSSEDKTLSSLEKK